MKRIVLFVEGEGEAVAAPRLINRLVTEHNGHADVFVDPSTFRIGSLESLAKSNFDGWKKKLRAAAKHKNFGGVLLLMDADSKSFLGEPFCAVSAAKRLAKSASLVGAGSQFSVACTFASMEFESWFIAAIEGFSDLPNGRSIRLPDQLPVDPETQPRDAKCWMRSVVSTGYKPTHDQAVFAERLDFDLLRRKSNRSFQRLEHSVKELIEAARTGNHVASPLGN